MWVHQDPLNNSLTVFIHGIFGSRWGTWKGFVDSFQKLAVQKALIRSFDFYLFQYDSGIRQPPIDPFVLDDLDRFLATAVGRYDTIALVCHSQGGLVGKLYTLREWENGRATPIDLIITFGTPHKGVVAATPVLWVGKLFGQLWPMQQLGELSRWSRNIKRLGAEWPKVLASRRDLSVVNIVGAYDRWVASQSAAGFGGEQLQSVMHGHPLKPRKSLEALAATITAVLERHCPPDALLKNIREIRATPQLLREYNDRFHQQVRDVLRNHMTAAEADLINDRVSGLLSEFLFDVEGNPPRKLDLERALMKYVRRQLEKRR